MARTGSDKKVDNGNSKGKRKSNITNASFPPGVPEIYGDMLADAVSAPTRVNEEGKTIKRRRIAGRVVIQGQDKVRDDQSDRLSMMAGQTVVKGRDNVSGAAMQQTAYNESDESLESDVDWEEIDVNQNLMHKGSSEPDESKNSELNLVLKTGDAEVRRTATATRKPITAAERNLRLDIHKLHILSLLFHVHLRNHWCNDEKIQGKMKSLLSDRNKSYLVPNDNLSQFQRSRSFIDGLTQASEAFKQKFKITARGMSRSFWAESQGVLAAIKLPKDLELPMQKLDFQAAAAKLEGSRDTGAQLFCTLLRSVGVDTRLVCSLQPLPFTATVRVTEPPRLTSASVLADPASKTASSADDSGVDVEVGVSPGTSEAIESSGGRHSRFTSSLPSRLGLSSQSNNIDLSTLNSRRIVKRSPPKRIKESPFPVFWVEAFEEAHQKWIPIDPLATSTISKPSKLEPPASDPQNSLTYVLAFEDDGSARDVTRRYTKAFMAKTRKSRVEVTSNGEKWWQKSLKLYKRSYRLHRDDVEDAELVGKAELERMPKNVLDFKDHPLYALERHLKRGEVIHPRREVGKVVAGRSERSQVLEPVFRRRDVLEVKSAESWYRAGREIKTGEQPLKRVPARRKRESTPDNSYGPDAPTEDQAGTPLYAGYQTTIYTPPPVHNGRIPKNIYSNLDIYVPSMVPSGGTHIPHPETARAARILGIDYADAVTGFEFRGRHGTAVFTGAVVASECCEAIREVLVAFEDERAREDEERRSMEALRMWKRLLVGLRVKERIEGYEIEGERKVDDERMKVDEEDNEDDDEERWGGFLPNGATDDDEEIRDGFLANRMAGAGSKPMAELFNKFGGQYRHEDEDEDRDGGGFVTEYSLEHRINAFKKTDDQLVVEEAGDTEDYDQNAGGGFITNDSADDGYHIEDHLPRTKITTNDAKHALGINSAINSTPDPPTPTPSPPQPPRSRRKVSAVLFSDGAGFISEKLNPYHADDNDNDGYITKNSNNQYPTKPTSAPTPASSCQPPPNPSSHLPLPPSVLAEATLLQQLHDSKARPAEETNPPTAQQLPGTGKEPSRSQQLGNDDDDDDDDDDGMSFSPRLIGEGGGMQELEGRRGAVFGESGEEGKEGESSSEDAGSLLSQDPADEDADPEWLA